MSVLDDWVRGQRDTVTWLDCDRYAWRVFAGAPGDWHEDTATLVSATAQAQTLVRSDVLAVSVVGPFSRHLTGAGEAEEICAALEREGPRRLLVDTVDALAHQLGDDVDMVLDCPSPRSILAAGPDASFDDLDDVAAGLLDVIRTMADRPVRGLRITCDAESGPDDDEIDAWSSLLAAARHYGWVATIELSAVTDPDLVDSAVPGDLLLLPRLSAEALPDDRRHGGGLPAETWTDTTEAVQLLDAATKRGFRFGEIPGDAVPETVLARLNALR